MASKSYMWAEDFEKAEELLKKVEAIKEKLELTPAKVDISGDVPLFKAYKGRRRREASPK